MSLREPIRNTTIADRLLFLFLIGASLTALLFIREVLPKSPDVRIEVQGRLTHRYPLDRDRFIHVAGPQGHLDVEIKGSRVRIINASCTGKLCEHCGWVESGTIICLPSRICVTVGGPAAGRERQPDAVTG